MMADKQRSVINEAVYWLDPKHRGYDHTHKKNFIKKIGSYNFKILQIKDSLGGMQAMAVTPVIHSKSEKNFKNKRIPANFRVLK